MAGLEKRIEVKQLKRLYQDHAAARALLEHLASRERDWRATTVDRLLHNLHRTDASVSRAALVEALRKLQEIGCGRFKAGRRGARTRFEWSVSMVSVGQFAVGEVESVASLAEDVADIEDDSMMKHTYKLRRDLTVELDLPGDLTAGEATRIAKFIETLPLDT